MRLIAAISTLLAITAAAFAGLRLHAVVTKAPLAVDLGVQAVSEQAFDQGVAVAAPAPSHWPPLFGELQPPAPPKPEPTPPPVPVSEPRPPLPPIESLGFQLKGLVRSDTSVWALVSHPSGERIMREGDTLAEGLVIARIDAAGVWLDGGRQDLLLLGFAEQ